MGRVEGKVALITGAGNGQGAAEARLLASEGAAVLLTDIDDRNGKRVADEIVAAGGRAAFLHQDTSSEADWHAALTKARDDFGGLNVLVNNAGIVPRLTLEETSLEVWDRCLAINLKGPMMGMKFAAPLIRDSGGGAIINISSSAGMFAHYDAAYTASKWGLRGLTKTAAVEYAPWGIRVNSVHPGIVEGTALVGNIAPAIAESSKAMIPMQRAATTKECADLVLFLASAESSYITGIEIPIDGGYVWGSTMFMRQQLRKKLSGG